MDAHRLPGCVGFVLAMALCPHAQGAECPREDALGRSRIFAVDAAATHPHLVRQIATAGHSIGHHTWSHQNLEVMKPEEAVDEIDRGIAVVEMALNGVSTTIPSMPFFRFPGFLTNRQTLDDLQKRRIVVFNGDIVVDDWIAVTRKAELKLLTDRLKAEGASSCCMIPRWKRPPCCRLSCVICVTTAIRSCMWFLELSPGSSLMSNKAKNVNNSNN